MKLMLLGAGPDPYSTYKVGSPHLMLLPFIVDLDMLTNFCNRKGALLSLAALLGSTVAHSLAVRQASPLPSGFYTIGAISVPGFSIGSIPGSLVGVQNPGPSDPVSA